MANITVKTSTAFINTTNRLISAVSRSTLLFNVSKIVLIPSSWFLNVDSLATSLKPALMAREIAILSRVEKPLRVSPFCISKTSSASGAEDDGSGDATRTNLLILRRA
jgi:hypothetical protein